MCKKCTRAHVPITAMVFYEVLRRVTWFLSQRVEGFGAVRKCSVYCCKSHLMCPRAFCSATPEESVSAVTDPGVREHTAAQSILTFCQT